MTRFIGLEEVRENLTMEELIPAMEDALARFSSGEVIQPVRQMVPVEEHGGVLAVMPALAGGLGVKLVGFYPTNEERGLPTHNALIVLFDPVTGQPQAVLDGTLITEMRTAAVSAAATRHLAAPDASVLALLGSGVQARSHFEALGKVRTFEEVRVWSRTAANAEKLASEIGARATSAEDAVRDADVVVTATSATEPVLEGAWLKPGAHINAVGACLPDWRELDDLVMKSCVLYVDSREAALQEAGDVIQTSAEIFAELGEMIAGAKPAETSRTTLFKSVGLAVEDVVSAKLVYDKLA